MVSRIKNHLIILLVDDSDADVLLAELAFEELGVPYQLHTVRDGVEALDFLRFGGATPDLILLDLNMPRMGGLEVLREIKVHEVWRNIPVIVLTTSKAEVDVWESYHRYANGYVSKPSSLSEFVESLRKLSVFWQSVALLPPKSPPSQ